MKSAENRRSGSPKKHETQPETNPAQEPKKWMKGVRVSPPVLNLKAMILDLSSKISGHVGKIS